jgi:formamidopyrimidine-DNA glycosylase
MPELPEIETFRQRFLYGSEDTPPLVGMSITDVNLLWERTLAEPTRNEFKEKVVGQTINDIHRRGKYLLFILGNGVLVFHLRMSGDLLVEAHTEPVAKHHRLLLTLDGRMRLSLNDTRKFGRVWYTENIEKFLSQLGPEPLDQEFTAETLYFKLQGRKRKIKPLLLDQHFLAGMGNIYTDEALFRSNIHPETIANTLNFTQTKKLLGGIRNVLFDAIKSNGSSIDWIYRGGEFQNHFQVYHRTGEPCYQCGTPIKRILVGQRGTHFCPNCQKLTSDE